MTRQAHKQAAVPASLTKDPDLATDILNTRFIEELIHWQHCVWRYAYWYFTKKISDYSYNMQLLSSRIRLICHCETSSDTKENVKQFPWLACEKCTPKGSWMLHFRWRGYVENNALVWLPYGTWAMWQCPILGHVGAGDWQVLMLISACLVVCHVATLALTTISSIGSDLCKPQQVSARAIVRAS